MSTYIFRKCSFSLPSLPERRALFATTFLFFLSLVCGLCDFCRHRSAKFERAGEQNCSAVAFSCCNAAGKEHFER